MIHRLAVPPAVKAAQLRHMVDTVAAQERITIQVLPNDIPLPGGLLPKASFFIDTFPEHDDPPMAVVDTVTTDLVLTKRNEVAKYTKLYDRLCGVALSPDESLDFLSGVADRLAQGAGSIA